MDGRSCSRQALIASTRIRATCWCTSTKSAYGKQQAEGRTVGRGGAERTPTSVSGPVRHHDRSFRGGTAAHSDGGQLPRIARGGIRSGESLLPRLRSDANPLRRTGRSIRKGTCDPGRVAWDGPRRRALRAVAQPHGPARRPLRHRRHRLRCLSDDVGLPGGSLPLQSPAAGYRQRIGLCGAGTTAGTLGAGLTAHVFSWRFFFLLPGAIALGVAIGLRGVPESLLTRSSHNPLKQVATVVRHGWAILVLALSVVNGAVMFGFVTYLAPALEANGQSPAIAGVVVASYGVSVLVCTRAFGYVAQRTPAALILAGGATMLLIGYAIAGATQTVVTILAASLLAGGAYAFMQSTFQTWATDVVPEARGTATALFATAIFTGAALATSAVAGLASANRYSTLFMIAALVTLPVLIFGSLARWRYRGSDAIARLTPEC
ncbi:MAG: MFS transporter [Chloroflexi bacterium]|nr:MAG: MFS transporter [Chloroflexota bacterium]